MEFITSTRHYCYSSECPVRTKKEPWPRSDIDPNKKRATCFHCGKKMTVVASAKDHNGEYLE